MMSEIRSRIMRVYLSIGSNLYNPEERVNSALLELKCLPKTKFLSNSSFYRTKPYGIENQPDYLNTAVKLDTQLLPDDLLLYTKNIENILGRVRGVRRWGPRIIDIDIMLFGSLIIQTSQLTVPHYDLCNRAFMIVPLLEIAPNIRLPTGIMVRSFLSKLDTTTISHWI